MPSRRGNWVPTRICINDGASTGGVEVDSEFMSISTGREGRCGLMTILIDDTVDIHSRKESLEISLLIGVGISVYIAVTLNM